MHIYLSEGHDAKRRGAVNAKYGLSEYDLAVPIAAMVFSELAHLPAVTLMEQDTLGNVIRSMKAKDVDKTISIEFHFNSNVGTPWRGCETLYLHNLALPLAESVQSATQGYMDNRDRGVKRRDNLGFLKTGSVSLILEPFFINNDDELEKFVIKEDKSGVDNWKLKALAKAMAFGIAAGYHRIT